FRKNDDNNLSMKKIYELAETNFDDFAVEGMVVDEEGEPMIGVNIMIKGKNIGTTTDFDGHFILEEVIDDDVLIISYIGYVTQELLAVEGQPLNIVLMESAEMLDEVVVVGYGTSQKKDLTGAVTRVGREFLDANATTVIRSLPSRNLGISGR